MSTPGAGNPDWQKIVQWRGLALVAKSQVFPAGTTDLGFFPVHGWAGINISASLSAGQGSVTIEHSTDNIGSNIILADTWELVTATSLLASLPMLTNWVHIKVVVPAAHTGTITLLVLPDNQVPEKPTYPWVGDVLGATGQVIAASAQLIDHYNLIRPGVVRFLLSPHDATGSITPFIYHAGPSGAGDTLLWTATAPTATQYYSVAVPDQPWLIVLGNSDAVNPHTIDYSVIYEQ